MDFLIILVIFLFHNDGQCQDPTKAKFKILDLTECDTTGSNPISWNVDLINVDENGNKKVNAEMDLKNIEVTEDLKYSLVIDKLNDDGTWNEDFYNEDGNLCEAIRKYVQKGWKKLLDITEPHPMSQCTFQRDLYKVQDFELLKTDVQIPPIYGRILCTLKLFDQDAENNNIMCAKFDIQVSDSDE